MEVSGHDSEGNEQSFSPPYTLLAGAFFEPMHHDGCTLSCYSVPLSVADPTLPLALAHSRVSLSQPRMAGSTEMCSTLTRTWSGLRVEGSGSSTVSFLKVSSLMKVSGRFASTIRVFLVIVGRFGGMWEWGWMADSVYCSTVQYGRSRGEGVLLRTV